jgi:hypothetical protein
VNILDRFKNLTPAQQVKIELLLSLVMLSCLLTIILCAIEIKNTESKIERECYARKVEVDGVNLTVWKECCVEALENRV